MASKVAEAANLNKFQCLFAWSKHITQSCQPDVIITEVKDKLLTSDCEWRSIIYNLVIAFECFVKDNIELALEYLRECESIIQAAESFGVGSLVKRNVESVKHVVHSSWAYCTARTHTEDEYRDYLLSIKKYCNLSRKQKAGVKGIQAACLMQYGEKGYQEAFKILQTAINQDPGEPEWPYLCGKILLFQRSKNQDVEAPSKLELDLFEKAYDMDKNAPAYYVSLAASLYDSVRKEKGNCPIRDRATRLYRAAAEKWPKSVYVNLMCASGLLDYAYPVRDTKLADKYLENALLMAPDSCHVHLVAGIFFYWPCKNHTAAIGHLNKARKRYTALVESILNNHVVNYRHALRQGMWDIKPDLQHPTYLDLHAGAPSPTFFIL